jgi:hypothetical protein
MFCPAVVSVTAALIRLQSFCMQTLRVQCWPIATSNALALSTLRLFADYSYKNRFCIAPFVRMHCNKPYCRQSGLFGVRALFE